MKKICRLCGKLLDELPIMKLYDMPYSAQGMPTKEEIFDDKSIQLDLFQCRFCGLVQFPCEPVDYYKDVIRSIGFSTTLPEIRKKEFNHFIKKFSLYGKKIIEVGAGQGEYLSILNEFPVQAYGIENKCELVDLAQKKGLRVTKNYIQDEKTILQDSPFDAFVCINFLEHQPYPCQFIRGISANLSDEGYGFITVPDFDYIVRNAGFYEFIHDHIVYYTKETFRLILENNGFEVLEFWVSNGDTLCAFVKKKSRVEISQLIENYDDLRMEIKAFIGECPEGRIAIWGASHQSFTIIQMTELKDYVSWIIDSAVFKQGRFSPASHIPIIGPEKIPFRDICSVVIIAPSYTKEISGILMDKYPMVSKIAAITDGKLKLIK